MSLLLLTNNEYDRSKHRSEGALFATHVEAVSGVRAFAADIVGAFGNKSELLTKKTDDAITAAYRALVERARATYSNLSGICDIRISVSGMTNEDNRTFILTTATGTALVPTFDKKGGRFTRKNRDNNRRNGIM